MDVRVFAKGLPKNLGRNAFIDSIKINTKGSKRILYFSKEESAFAYALLWFDSMDNALDALKKVIYVRSTRIELYLYDGPRAQTSVSVVENRLSESLLIEGKSVMKAHIAYSHGLQQAVSGYRQPKWCKYTLSEIDCPRGELCNYIHLRRSQTTVYPEKSVWSIQQIPISENISTDDGKLLYRAHKLILPCASDKSVRSHCSEDILIALKEQNLNPKDIIVDNQGCDLVQLFLQNKAIVMDLASKMDKAVEEHIAFHKGKSFESAYLQVISQCPLNQRMTVSLTVIVDFLRSFSYESPLSDSILSMSRQSLGDKHSEESFIIVRDAFPKFELEYFVTISYSADTQLAQPCVELIFPVYDFLFSKKSVYHYQNIHESILAFTEEVASYLVRRLITHYVEPSGRLTLRIGYQFPSSTFLIGVYRDGPQVNEQFFAQLREQPWKKVLWLDQKAPFILIIDFPPVKAIQSSAPQSWLRFLKCHCEYR